MHDTGMVVQSPTLLVQDFRKNESMLGSCAAVCCSFLWKSWEPAGNYMFILVRMFVFWGCGWLNVMLVDVEWIRSELWWSNCQHSFWNHTQPLFLGNIKMCGNAQTTILLKVIAETFFICACVKHLSEHCTRSFIRCRASHLFEEFSKFAE